MRQLLTSVALVVPLFLAGCGGGKHKVPGKVVQAGQPLTVSDQGKFVITFIPEGGKGAIGTSTRPDGTFVVTGTDGKGIAPGKYKVAVQAWDPYPRKDKLGGKYNEANTRLTVEVGTGEVVLDVGQ